MTFSVWSPLMRQVDFVRTVLKQDDSTETATNTAGQMPDTMHTETVWPQYFALYICPVSYTHLTLPTILLV